MKHEDFTLCDGFDTDPSGRTAYIPKEQFETAMKEVGLTKERSNNYMNSSAVRFVGTYLNCYIQLHCHIIHAPDPNDPSGPRSKLVVCTDPTSNIMFNFYRIETNLLEAVNVVGPGSQTQHNKVYKLIRDRLEPDEDDGYDYSTQKNFD